MSKEQILGKLAGFIYWCYSLTFRYRFHFDNEAARAGYKTLCTPIPGPDKSIIVGCWHQDEVPSMGFFKFKKICIMVSDSKDGEIFSNALHFLGFETVRGSSSRGGIKAFLSALKKVKAGSNMAIAVDGPKGPIFEVKEGIVKLCEKSGVNILPYRANPRKFYTFEKSWSKGRLPYPFSIIDVNIGEPGIYTAKELQEKLLSYDK